MNDHDQVINVIATRAKVQIMGEIIQHKHLTEEQLQAQYCKVVQHMYSLLPRVEQESSIWLKAITKPKSEVDPASVSSQSEEMSLKISGETIDNVDKVLFKNKFYRNCKERGYYAGKWCNNANPHNIEMCTFAHKAAYCLAEGKVVPAVSIIPNVVTEEYLNTGKPIKATRCTKKDAHDIKTCNHLHFV